MSGEPPSPEAIAAMQAAAHKFNVEAFTLLAVAVVFVLLRSIQRIHSVGFKKLQLDDYLMVFAIVLYGLETGAAYSVGAWFKGLANNGMTPEQRISLDPNSEEYQHRVDGSKLQIIGWNLYTLLLWTLKMCMCVFYNRLTQGLDHMSLRINIGYGMIVTTYLATMLSILFACYPLERNWQIYPDPGNTCQPAISRVNCLVTVVLNVLTDLYLMSIPLPLLWKARLEMKRKALLLFMFGGGFFVIACGILRCALILIDPLNGAQQAGSWAVRETFVSVIIGNLPMVYKLFRIASRSAVETVKTQRSHRAQLYGNDSKHNPPTYYGSPLNSQMSRKNRFLHPLSLRNGTFSESQEELHLENIKESGVIMTTELHVQETERPSSSGGKNSGVTDARDNGTAHIQALREQLYRDPKGY